MNQVLRATACVAVFIFTIGCEGEKPDNKSVSQNVSNVEKPIGVVSTIASSNQKSSVEVLRKGKPGWTSVSGNLSVFVGDKVRTDKASVASIRMASGPVVAINGDTRIEPTAPSSMKLEKGELWIDAKSPLRVETAEGDADVKSGMGSIRSTDSQTVVSWISGSAVLQGKTGSMPVSGGDEATADAEGVRRTVIKDPSSLVAWTEKVRHAVSPASNVDGNLIPPPILGLGTLTAKLPGGGKPLPFRILTEDVQVHIQDNMAVTRVEQVFQNPTRQVVEAEYKFPIPENASLTGYDMEINGRMMKGEIVERDKGRKILKKVIDDYLYLMRDPALTEWESGSTFKTRIFPVQPGEQKRIVLTHLMPLSGAAGDYRYVLPLSMGATDSPTISKFRIAATVASSLGAPMVTTPVYAATIEPLDKTVKVGFEANSFVPRADFVMSIRTPSVKDASLVTFGKGVNGGNAPASNIQLTGLSSFVRPADENMFLLRLSPTFEPDGRVPKGADWLFLVDTSESRFGPDMEVQKRLIAALIDTLGPEDRVKVMGFDTFPVLMDSMWMTPEVITKQRAMEFLSRVEPGGATNLGDALSRAAVQADPSRPLKVLIIGDGAATLGVTAPSALADLAAGLFPYPHSVSAVGIGSSVDKLALEEVTRRTRGRYFSVSSGEDLFEAAVRVALGLRGPVLESPELLLSGVVTSDIVPAAISNLSSGGELLVSGRYQGTGTLTATLSGSLNGQPWKKEWSFDVGEASQTNSFVPLVYAAKKIDALVLNDSDAARRETIALSKKYNIASRLTSFIVLENEAMYREFNVERNERAAWSGDGEIDYENSNEVFEEEKIAVGPAQKEAPSGAYAGSGAGGGGMDKVSSVTDRPESGYGRSSEFAAKRAAPKPAKSAPMDDIVTPSPPAFAPQPTTEASDLLRTRDNDRGRLSRIADCSDEYGCDFDYHDHEYRPRPSWEVSIRQPASTPSARAMDKSRELAAAVSAAPLDRRARKALVTELLSASLLDEAARSIAEWSTVDRSNPEVHVLKGDLLRRQGDLPGALRAYSGVIDLQPENSRILSSLAAYFEARERWNEAYPFRTSLVTVKPKDLNQKVQLAVCALKAGRTFDAAAITALMTERDRSGYPMLKRGIKLAKADRDTVLSIRATGNLPLLFDTASTDLRSAGLKITLSWDRPVTLDLWVSTNKDKYVGGAFGKTRLLANAEGQEKVFFVGGSAEGKFRAEVVCAEQKGCEGTSGRLTVESHGKSRIIPFVMKGGIGMDLAVIQISQSWTNKYW
jgi:tetratricopeptide (TPR) repeat protein